MGIQNLSILAQANDDAAAAAAAMGSMLCVLVVAAAISLIAMIGMWKVFEKAGKPGWAAIIPIYQGIVLAEVAGKPLLWGLLLLVPCVNFIVFIILCIEVAKNFGKSAGFGLGLALLPIIFFPLLGFSDAKYQPQSVPAGE